SPAPGIAWPLQVGKFSQRPAVLLSRLPRPLSSFPGGLQVIYSVATYEDVEAHGSVIKAFKIIQRMDNVNPQAAVNEIGRFVVWYAPELRQFVKAEGGLLGANFDFTSPPTLPVIASPPAGVQPVDFPPADTAKAIVVPAVAS